MSEVEMLEERLREFAAAPEATGDWEDVLGRAGERLAARRFPQRRFALALAAALTVAAAAALVGVFVAHGTRETSRGGRLVGTGGPAGPVGSYVHTLAEPLPSGKRVSLSRAASALGVPIVLPDTPQVARSDVGAVWMDQEFNGEGHYYTAVAVTFPSRDLMILYERPSLPDPLAPIQYSLTDSPGSQEISLNGVAAVWIPHKPDGSNWGSITFMADGATIVVASHNSEAFLQSVAQSILDRSAG